VQLEFTWALSEDHRVVVESFRFVDNGY